MVDMGYRIICSTDKTQIFLKYEGKEWCLDKFAIAPDIKRYEWIRRDGENDAEYLARVNTYDPSARPVQQNELEFMLKHGCTPCAKCLNANQVV